jgi:hypothetical protein
VASPAVDGLDVVTDGEWRRVSCIGAIAALAHGFSRLSGGRQARVKPPPSG